MGIFFQLFVVQMNASPTTSRRQGSLAQPTITKKMSKKKEKYDENFTVEIGLFSQQVMFHFGGTALLKEQLAKHFKKHQYEHILKDIGSKEFLGATYSLPKGVLVYMPNVPKTDADYGTLAHEILHAVFWITEKVGIEYSSKGEEVYTHLMQSLLQSALETLHEDASTSS